MAKKYGSENSSTSVERIKKPGELFRLFLGGVVDIGNKLFQISATFGDVGGIDFCHASRMKLEAPSHFFILRAVFSA